MDNPGNHCFGARVLLVDDDPVILELLSEGLSRTGYCVDAFTAAGAAAEAYRQAPHDVAVLDVGLPDKPGTELARELLRAEYRPILMLSGRRDLDIVHEAARSGVAGYLVKPVAVEQLIPSLETSLSQHQRRSASIAAHLGGAAISASNLAEFLDQFPFALLVVDATQHPVYRNARARELLDAGVLDVDPAGRLRSSNGSEHIAVLLDRALGMRTPARWGAALLDDSDGRRLHAWAAPLESSRAPGDEPLAAVTVFDTTLQPSYAWGVLETLYGLTRTETCLINQLLKGRTLEEYCASRFVTINTARSHLKSIYRKTGTNRQSELIRLFATMFMPTPN